MNVANVFIRYLNNQAAIPNIIAAMMFQSNVLEGDLKLSGIEKTVCSIPSICVVQSARKEQMITGMISYIFLGLKDSHSKAKTMPATGVPKTDPNPAATADLKKMVSSLSDSLNN